MKNEKNKNQGSVVTLSITIVVFLALIFTATYAIIEVSRTGNNVTVNTNVGTRPVFVSTPGTTVSLSVPIVPQTVTSGYELTNSTSTVNISLSNASGKTECAYDIVWQWESASDNYVITTGATKEFTISGTNGTSTFSETQVSNTASGSKTLLNSSISVSNGSIVTQNWTFTMKFYKTPAIQTAHLGKEYSGKVVIANVNCAKGS